MILNVDTLLIRGLVVRQPRIQVKEISHALHQEYEGALACGHHLSRLLLNRSEVHRYVAVPLDAERCLRLLELGWLRLYRKHDLVLGDVVASKVDSLVVIHQAVSCRGRRRPIFLLLIISAL